MAKDENSKCVSFDYAELKFECLRLHHTSLNNVLLLILLPMFIVVGFGILIFMRAICVQDGAQHEAGASVHLFL